MTQTPTQPTFSDAAAQHLRALQASMTDLLDDAGLTHVRPVTLGRRFGVDKTLAWKVSRFVSDRDVLGAARHMPGWGGIEIVLKAAEEFGVGAGRVQAVRAAEAALRQFVDQQAGDRRTFEAMLAGVARDERAEMDERRAFYRAGSAIWGVRARSQFLMFAFRPSETDPDRLDTMDVAGFQSLERLRPDVPWLIRRLHVVKGDGDTQSGAQARSEALDPATPREQPLSLLTDFCTTPLPEFRQFEGPDGGMYCELAPGALGRASAVDCISGEIYRSMLARRWSETNQAGTYGLGVRTPIESATFDLLLHESLVEYTDVQGSVVASIENLPRGFLAEESRQRSLLQPWGPALELGHPPMVHTPRVTEYSRIVSRAFELAGWSLSEFRGYRIEMEYPPAPCTMMLQCAIGR